MEDETEPDVCLLMSMRPFLSPLRKAGQVPPNDPNLMNSDPKKLEKDPTS